MYDYQYGRYYPNITLIFLRINSLFIYSNTYSIFNAVWVRENEMYVYMNLSSHLG